MTSIASTWNRLWFSEGSLVALGVWRVLILTIAGYATAFPSSIILSYAGSSGDEVGHLWNPVYFVEALGIGPPDLHVARAMITLLVVAYVMGILGLFTRTATLIVAVLGVFWWGLGYSFGQAHHEKISLAFALITLPLSPCGARISLDAIIRRWRGQPTPDRSVFATWPIRLVQVSIALTYLFAGGSKILVSGFEWMNGYTLQSIMSHEVDPVARAIASNVSLAQAASIAVIALQATFPLVFIHRHLRWIYVPGTVAFHLGAWITMDPGPYYTLWLTTTVTFFHVDRVPQSLRSSWRYGRRIRVAVQGMALLGFAALCIGIMVRDNPPVTRYLLIAAGTVASVLAIHHVFRGHPAGGEAPGASQR